MKPKLLFLAHLLPWPLMGGGQIKSYHTLCLLASRFDITLLAFVRRENEEEARAELLPFCAGGVHTVPLPRGRWRDLLTGLRALLTGKSFLLLRDDVPAMQSAVQAQLESDFAAVHVDHLQMMSFLPAEARAKIVLDQHNVEHLLLKRLSDTSSSFLMRSFAAREERLLRRFEAESCERSDLVLTVSEEDASFFRGMVGQQRADRVRVTPIGVDTEYFTLSPRPASSTILTVGTMYWPPNVAGAQWFCAEVMPRIKERLPEVQFVIAGARPSRAVQNLASSNVRVTGTVPDVRPLMQECGVFVAPLLAGSGMRVKILNAMAMGLPIVSTSVGAEGIQVAPGRDLLIANSPQDFANAVVRVLTEPDLQTRIGSAARELAVRRYDWNVVGAELYAAYDSLETGA